MHHICGVRIVKASITVIADQCLWLIWNKRSTRRIDHARSVAEVDTTCCIILTLTLV